MYLSFDCASKSLGIALVTDDEKLLIYKTVNLIEDKMLKETDTLYRSIQLKKFLNEFDKLYTKDQNFNVLIEYQMNANDKSREIYHYLIYHYNEYPVHLVNPGLKNKLDFDVPELHISNFYAKYSNMEYARKKHTIALANHYCTIMNYNSPEIMNTVRNSKEDDCADALMQIVAYLKFKCPVIGKSDIQLLDTTKKYLTTESDDKKIKSVVKQKNKPKMKPKSEVKLDLKID